MDSEGAEFCVHEVRTVLHCVDLFVTEPRKEKSFVEQMRDLKVSLFARVFIFPVIAEVDEEYSPIFSERTLCFTKDSRGSCST